MQVREGAGVSALSALKKQVRGEKSKSTRSAVCHTTHPLLCWYSTATTGSFLRLLPSTVFTLPADAWPTVPDRCTKQKTKKMRHEQQPQAPGQNTCQADCCCHRLQLLLLEVGVVVGVVVGVRRCQGCVPGLPLPLHSSQHRVAVVPGALMRHPAHSLCSAVRCVCVCACFQH